MVFLYGHAGFFASVGLAPSITNFSITKHLTTITSTFASNAEIAIVRNKVGLSGEIASFAFFYFSTESINSIPLMNFLTSAVCRV